MLNIYEDDEAPKKSTPGFKIDGDFRCSHCGEDVDEGMYYPAVSTLSYFCSKGHETAVENLKLG